MPSLMRRINVISRCAGIYREKRFKDIDLSACHAPYILAICKNPGISQDKLARHICINRSNVTRQLSYLETHGYVERRQSEEDKRVLMVYPTDKAYEILPFVKETSREWNSYITEGFSEDELDQLAEMLERLAKRSREFADGKGNDE